LTSSCFNRVQRGRRSGCWSAAEFSPECIRRGERRRYRSPNPCVERR